MLDHGLFTHPYTAAQMKEHFFRVGVEVRSELARSAPGRGVGDLTMRVP